MERTQRAYPPIGHELRFDGHMRRFGLYDLDINCETQQPAQTASLFCLVEQI